MPPLLCLSPLILDQTFPRNEGELRLANDALGAVGESVLAGDVHLLVTEVLREFVLGVDMYRADPSGLWSLLYRGLAAWFLSPDSRVVQVDTATASNWQPHLLPTYCAGEEGLAAFWAEEAGRLLALHDACSPGAQFFIGVACAYGFAGGSVASVYGESTGVWVRRHRFGRPKQTIERRGLFPSRGLGSRRPFERIYVEVGTSRRRYQQTHPQTRV